MFKNKAEREKFLWGYKEWPTLENGDYKNIYWHEVDISLYRYQFNNKAVVIVTECPEIRHSQRYSLITPKNDNYNPWNKRSDRFPSVCKNYDLQDIPISIIVNYMTKYKDVI